MARRRHRDNATPDLFEDLYPVRRPSNKRAADFDTTLRHAVSDALAEAKVKLGKTRARVAAEMGEWLGNSRFSEAMLNQYAAESNETHNINVKTLVALMEATDCNWLLDVPAEWRGCVVLEGEEARLAELGRVRRQKAELDKREKALMAAPIRLSRGRS